MKLEIGTLINNLHILRQVVSKRVNLDANDYAPCPFHEEKTSSFNIFLAKSGRARFHCFGCGIDGDAITFLQGITPGLGFNQALTKLHKLTNSSPSSQRSAHNGQGQKQDPDPEPRSDFGFCERDCQKYINLREDYYWLLEINEGLHLGHDLG